MTNQVDLSAVLVRPLINEKSTLQRDRLNQYVFEVLPTASKLDVKAAVEKYFSVKVTAVRTSIGHGKVRRVGKTMGRRSNAKRAVVTVASGQKIDFFAAA